MVAFARQRGLALVLVLWILMILSLMAAAFLTETRTESTAVRYRIDAAQAQAAADAATNWAIWKLLLERGAARPPEGVDVELVPADGRRIPWTFRDTEGERVGDVTVRFYDEAGKVDLNAADPRILSRLLRVLGVERGRAAVLAGRIADFRQPGDEGRLGGATSADYAAAGLSYGPKNSPFDSVDEVAQVLGVDLDLAQRMRPHVTVSVGAPIVDPSVATRPALLAMPGLTAGPVDEYLAARAEATPETMPSPPSGPSYSTSPRRAYTIRARAELPGGATFVREALVRLDRRGSERPYRIEDWRQSMEEGAGTQRGRDE